MTTPAELRAFLEGRGADAGTPGAIEASEAAGQVELTRNSSLPSDMSAQRGLATAQTGIEFHEDVDELFVNVTLPTGWSKKATSHSMWSDLLDDKGRVRARIFYKAAFYDRKAHMRFEPFYSVPYDSKKGIASVVNANGDTVKNLGQVIIPEDYKDPAYARQSDRYYGLRREAEKWLMSKYPYSDDPFAYWD